jgi:hypothetical protein
MRKQNAVLIIAIALVLAAPPVALAHKKKATSSEHFHFSHSETNRSLIQHHSNSPIHHPAPAEWREDREALGHGTVGKSAGFK